ncbi:protein CUSTOS isoform X2 [Pangasianodon hypophthalmus]|uniref:protein CUSTOS isoform X2 n=1 Tax=Pangasianodon hypophthalmus TaxID=310915 RepID=UPI000F0096E6|nr:protein CUSTOS isoform X2 [Pangasianodon hypophthalmus]
MMSARDSSSSEDENTDRIKEAVWSFGAETHKMHEDGEKHTHSKRLKVSEHEHDGNQLKTTPEFRSHVAKKLGAMLDSVICEVSRETPDCKPVPCENTQDEADDGFRLFSTSLPGNWREEPKQAPPPKRRPAPSSSDSDSEMESRLREAAVSVSDLLPSSFTERRQENERTDAGARDEESAEPKKKKKKKKREVVTEREEDEWLEQGDGAVSQEQSREKNTLKKKKKKKNVNEGVKE